MTTLLSATWLEHLEADTHAVTHNSNQQKISKITDASSSTDDFKSNIRHNLDMVFIGICPIQDKTITIFHHTPLFGGSITSPTKKLVALQRFGTKALSIHLALTTLHFTLSIQAPLWATLK